MSTTYEGFDPELHDKHYRQWRMDEIKYLIDFYYSKGCQHVALALGRTPGTVTARAPILRDQGQLKKPAVMRKFRRNKDV